MALHNYTTQNTVLTINGRQITDWGSSANGLQMSPLRDEKDLVQGQGGRAVVTGVSNPGKLVTLNIMPGSPDAKYLSSLKNAGTLGIVATYAVTGTSEFASGFEGIFTTVNEATRAGMTVSDSGFVLKFNRWGEMYGGE